MTALSANSLDTPIKRQRLEEWTKNHDSAISTPQEIHFNIMI